MSIDIRPYPVYKDSGVPCLGQVPEHWEVPRLKQVCTRSALYGANVPASEYSADGIRFLRTTDICDDGSLTPDGVYVPPKSAAEYVLDDGDLLISRSGTIGRSFVYDSARHGPCAYAGYLVRFVLGTRVIPRYVMYYTKTPPFADFLKLVSIQSTIENVNAEKYANLVLPLPSVPEQTAIVRYLDHADRKVRHAIRARQRLITLLTEQKQAIIQRAVTRGLDPNVHLKPSGIPWLGDVPEHWEVATLRRYLRPVDGIKIGPFGSQLKLDQMSRSGYKVYGQANVIANDFAVGSKFVDSEKYDELSTCEVRPGDLLVTMMGTSGRCASVPQGAAAGIMDSHLLRLRMGARVDVNFAAFIVNDSSYVKEQIAAIGKGSIMLGLNSSMVKDIVLALPPLSEQAIVLRYLDAATANLDKAIDAARREIDLLREYRTRLIADVVTGKLDVRDAATHLPDELEEQSEPLDEEPADDAADLESEEEGNGEQTES